VLFNEPKLLKCVVPFSFIFTILGFSALQRAEIAEMRKLCILRVLLLTVSVLFNEPKLLKFNRIWIHTKLRESFSALQRAEIAEIVLTNQTGILSIRFQCSSTSRNC